jgi:cephalosporin-C deacetylase-like acetyl esterase
LLIQHDHLLLVFEKLSGVVLRWLEGLRCLWGLEGRVAIAGKAIGGTVGVLINVMDVATRKTTAVAQTVAAVARTTSQSGAIVVQTYFRTIRTTDEMV